MMIHLRYGTILVHARVECLEVIWGMPTPTAGPAPQGVSPCPSHSPDERVEWKGIHRLQSIQEIRVMNVIFGHA